MTKKHVASRATTIQARPLVNQTGIRGKIRTYLLQGVAKLDSIGLGDPLRALLLLVVAAIPIIQSTGRLSGGWVWGIVVIFLLLFIAQFVLEHYKHASERYNTFQRYSRVNNELGGSIADVSRAIQAADQSHPFNDAECNSLCKTLLEHIHQYTRTTVGVDKTQDFRVTFAVPVERYSDNALKYLRVWCYNKPHANRRWSLLHASWPGAPMAFITGEMQIVEDINKALEDAGLQERHREYRSILCIPVKGTNHNEVLGVVSIDARDAGFFSLEVFFDLHPFIYPTLETLALTLQLRPRGAPYEFPN